MSKTELIAQIQLSMYELYEEERRLLKDYQSALLKFQALIDRIEKEGLV